ncbi:MAG: erythromycin esterase family protein, partial [Bacteroidota bacterium]
MRTFLLLVMWGHVLVSLLPAQSSQKVSRLLEKATLPIHSAELTAGQTDLEAIAPLLESVTVLGLGEATHGSREFFTLKARLIRYGIEHLGFRVVAFEAPFDQEGINRFVQGEAIKLEKVMPELSYWPWNTVEVRELLIWLRAYNEGKSPADRVRFVGIDTQSLAGARKWQKCLQAGKADTEIPFAVARLDTLAKLKTWALTSASLSWLDSSMLAVDQVEAWATQRASTWASISSDIDFVWAQHHLEVIRQVLTHFIRKKQEAPGYWNHRDSCMAANVKWVRETGFPGEKILLWAHNGHISKFGDEKQHGAYRRMGCYLKRYFQAEYYALGFDFGEGNLIARGPNGSLDKWSLPSAHRKSLAYQLSAVPYQMCWLDETRLMDQPGLSKWLQKPWWMRVVGSGFNPEANRKYYYSKSFPPFERYDGILFVKNVRATRPLISPLIGRTIPVAGFEGQDIRIEARVRLMAEADTSCRPRMLLHCWTQHSTLAMLVADPVQDSLSGDWHMRLKGNVPTGTTILKCDLFTTAGAA